ncbi:MAG: ABC transporter substrate-binding protein [Reyranellaceae bacterium]
MKTMNRRGVMAGGAGLAAAGLAQAHAQGAVRTVGYLSNGERGDSLNAVWSKAILEGLASQGFTVPGRLRWLDRYTGRPGREGLEALALRLLEEGAELITTNGASVRAAMSAVGGKVPIVFGFSADPVLAGLTDSLARPNHNATGVTMMMVELNAKRIEILKQLVPTIRRIALLSFPNHPGEAGEIDVCRRTVASLGIELQYLPVLDTSAVPKALADAEAAKADALIALPDPVSIRSRSELAAWAIARRMPFASGWSVLADAGALMTYGPSLSASYQRVGWYAARILQGAKPADLPVEQPTQFEMVLNLATAKAINLQVPPMLQAIADRTID